GVRVCFKGHVGTVSIDWPGVKKHEEIQTKGDVLPFAPNKWYRLRVTDDGETISVYLSGPEMQKKYWKEPVLQAHPPALAWQGHHVAIYNRERVADVPHESHIDNVLIERLR